MISPLPQKSLQQGYAACRITFEAKLMISNWICLLATVDEILLLKFERRSGVSLRPAFFTAHRIYDVFSSYPVKTYRPLPFG
jgi:hypothetical protein